MTQEANKGRRLRKRKALEMEIEWLAASRPLFWYEFSYRLEYVFVFPCFYLSCRKNFFLQWEDFFIMNILRGSSYLIDWVIDWVQMVLELGLSWGPCWIPISLDILMHTCVCRSWCLIRVFTSTNHCSIHTQTFYWNISAHSFRPSGITDAQLLYISSGTLHCYRASYPHSNLASYSKAPRAQPRSNPFFEISTVISLRAGSL